VPGNPSIRVRPLERDDKRLVSTLLATCRWRHYHLDWQEPVDLLGQQPYLVAESGATFVGCLACPEGPDGIAWIRVLCLGLGVDPPSVWQTLWEQARDRLFLAGVRVAASLLSGTWQRALLEGSGFRETNSVVFFERSTRNPAPRRPGPATLRRFEEADLAAVLQVDHLAFRPLWQVSQQTLGVAYHQAAEAAVAEVDGRIVGYQLTTISPLGAHLARLAVTPAWQGQGVGAAMVAGLLERLPDRGVTRITLNTQSDNTISQDLYRKLGFRETGEVLPVYESTWPSKAASGADHGV
jgi:ribosomal protein S18 acetylase RimI-like enzyme